MGFVVMMMMHGMTGLGGGEIECIVFVLSCECMVSI